MLRVSRGLSWVQSGDLVWGSDSPVREELSTCIWCQRHTSTTGFTDSWQTTEVYKPHTLQPWEETILRSAGIRSPPLTSTRSPATTSSALICIFSPSRITNACCGQKKCEHFSSLFLCVPVSFRFCMDCCQYLWHHVFKGLHDLGALCLLEVWEATGDDDYSRQHDSQVQLRGDQRRHIQFCGFTEKAHVAGCWCEMYMHIISSRLVFSGSLNGIGQEAENGSGPQQDGETSEQLTTEFNPFRCCGWWGQSIWPISRQIISGLCIS